MCFALWLILYLFFSFPILSKKGISKIYYILLGLSALIAFYIISPNNRIYSFHGFWHAGIVYQILDGKIPPTNPLLGGQPLVFYWGYHYLAAWITKIFNITPFYSFSFISAISLLVTLILAYKISSLLIRDEKANIFSAAISVFGMSIVNHYLLEEIFPGYASRIMIKGTPIFNKFSNINGDVLGFVFFLLFLYSVIKIFETRKNIFYMLVFFVSVLGGGFFYPGILLGVVTSIIPIFLVLAIVSKKNNFIVNFRKTVFVAVLLSIAILILWPYLSSISQGMAKNIQFPNIRAVVIKIVKYFIVSFPILAVIYINKGYLKKNIDREALLIILAVIVTNLFLYILICLSWENEYKFFMFSTLGLGIIGGVAFSAMSKRCNNFAMFILLFLFLSSTYFDMRMKIARLKDVVNTCVEKGKNVYHRDKEEDKLYQWITNNTSLDSIFVDSELTIPVFAKRQLFIGMGEERDWEKNLGYSAPIKDILLMCGYDYNLIEKRRRIVKGIYDITQKSLDKETEDFFSLNKDIYIVVRTKAIESKFNQNRFDRVFKSAEGNFLVYKPKNTGYSQRGL